MSAASERNSKPLPALDDTLESQIWKRFDQQICANELSVFSACIIGFCDSATVQLKNLLEKLDICPWFSSLDVDALDDLRFLAGRQFYVLVNAQAYEDTVDLVERLISFREKCSEAIVVLISSDVSGDDLNAERCAISDATLRAPVDQSRLRSGLSSALVNNRELKAKQLQMGLF